MAAGGMGASSPLMIIGSDVAVSCARRAATVLFVLLSAFMSSSPTTDDAGNVNYAAGVDAQR